MKRDMDLIRKILFNIEEYEHALAPKEINIDGYNQDQIGYHIYIMGEAGLLEVIERTTLDCSSPIAQARSITWEGHDFLDAIRSDTIWEKTKRKITEAGASMAFEIVKTIAIAISIKQIGL